MLRHLVEKFEREASEFCKKEVTLSEDSFYSGEQRSYYKKLVVNGKETRHHIDLFRLQEASACKKQVRVVESTNRSEQLLVSLF